MFYCDYCDWKQHQLFCCWKQLLMSGSDYCDVLLWLKTTSDVWFWLFWLKITSDVLLWLKTTSDVWFWLLWLKITSDVLLWLKTTSDVWFWLLWLKITSDVLLINHECYRVDSVVFFVVLLRSQPDLNS